MNNTPTEALKTVVHDKIAEPRLTDEQISALNAHLDPEIKPLKPWSNIAIAAGLILCLGLGLLAHTQWQNWDREQLFIAIAKEVVENHLKQRPLEFQSRNLNQLNQQFSELDFTLVNTIQLPNLNTDLLGGRYCSIQGMTAAQLRLQESDGQATTLYQVPFSPEHFAKLGNINVDEQPVLRYVKGYSVTLWEEKGVLLALVQAPDSAHLNSGIQPPRLNPPEL